MKRKFEVLTISRTIVCDTPVEANWFAQGHMADNDTDKCVVIVTKANKIECACVVKREGNQS